MAWIGLGLGLLFGFVCLGHILVLSMWVWGLRRRTARMLESHFGFDVVGLGAAAAYGTGAFTPIGRNDRTVWTCSGKEC